MHQQCKGVIFFGESGLRQGGPLVHMLETDGTQLMILAQLFLANFWEFFAGQVGMSFAGLLLVIWE